MPVPRTFKEHGVLIHWDVLPPVFCRHWMPSTPWLQTSNTLSTRSSFPRPLTSSRTLAIAFGMGLAFWLSLSTLCTRKCITWMPYDSNKWAQAASPFSLLQPRGFFQFTVSTDVAQVTVPHRVALSQGRWCRWACLKASLDFHGSA